MSFPCRFVSVVIMLWSVAMCPAASGAEELTVSVRGRASFARPVSLVRVSVDVVGVGDDAAAAAASLDAHVREALGKLAGLGADPASVALGRITVAATVAPLPLITAGGVVAGEPTPADLPAALVARSSSLAPLRLEAVVGDGADEPVEKRLERTLTFDVALRAGSAAEVSDEIDAVEARIGDADLSGVKKIEALRAEHDVPGEGPKRPCLCGVGVPSFERICRLSREESVSLAAAALDDAFRRAETLAMAAGGSIAGMVSVERIELPDEALPGDVLEGEQRVELSVQFRVRRE